MSRQYTLAFRTISIVNKKYHIGIDRIITNTTMPQMTESELRKALKYHSNKIDFNEQQHTYKYGGEIYPSVSTVLYRYVPEFDEVRMSQLSAKKYNKTAKVHKTAAQLRAEWKMKRDIAANYGSFIHEELERYVIAKYLPHKTLKTLTLDMNLITDELYAEAMESIGAGKGWIDARIEAGYRIVDTEPLLLDAGLGYCGTPDILFMHQGRLILSDYKTNRKDIEGDTYGKLKFPLNSYNSNTLNKYKVQLNLYKVLIESIFGVEVAEMEVVHIRDGKVGIHQVEDMTHIIRPAKQTKLNLW